MTRIQQKYILPFLLGLSFLATVYIFFILNQHTNLLKTELQRKGKSVLVNFAEASRVDILLEDEEHLQRLLQQTIQDNEDINISSIYIKSSQSLLSNDSNFVFPELEISKYSEYDLPEYFLFVQPIEEQLDNTIGLVGVTISKTRLNNIIYDIGLRLVFLGLLAFAVVGYFVNFLSKRLRLLAQNALAEAKQIEGAYVELQDLQYELEATNSSLEGRVKKRSFELKTANINFETVNGELKEFAYIVSHDLKAPLRAIDSLTGWIVEDYEDNLDKEGRELIQTLKSRVTTMNQLIDGILQYSRISQLKSMPEEVDLNEIITYVWSIGKPTKPFNLSIIKELPTVFTNYDKMQALFQKIIENAIRFNDKSQGQITIDWSEDDTFIHIKIEDNGIGILEKDFEEIFKIFRTLDKKKHKNQIGLGLTLAKRIVEVYDGHISIQSIIDKSTTFTISLPKIEIKPVAIIETAIESNV